MNGTSAKVPVAMDFLPNLGFTINGISGQNTITESTQYTWGLPLEIQGVFASYKSSSTQASFFFDAKGGPDILSMPLAQKLGTGRVFLVGQVAAGIVFASNVRVGFQYFFGPSNAYCTTGSSTCTPPTPGTPGFNGFHLVLSFSPVKSKSPS
jgi:hypothetical protein